MKVDIKIPSKIKEQVEQVGATLSNSGAKKTNLALDNLIDFPYLLENKTSLIILPALITLQKEGHLLPITMDELLFYIESEVSSKIKKIIFYLSEQPICERCKNILTKEEDKWVCNDCKISYKEPPEYKKRYFVTKQEAFDACEKLHKLISISILEECPKCGYFKPYLSTEIKFRIECPKCGTFLEKKYGTSLVDGERILKNKIDAVWFEGFIFYLLKTNENLKFIDKYYIIKKEENSHELDIIGITKDEKAVVFECKAKNKFDSISTKDFRKDFDWNKYRVLQEIFDKIVLVTNTSFSDTIKKEYDKKTIFIEGRDIFDIPDKSF